MLNFIRISFQENFYWTKNLKEYEFSTGCFFNSNSIHHRDRLTREIQIEG